MRVLFVSKPVVAPWNDGSKNLVRDLATNFREAEPTLMVGPLGDPQGRPYGSRTTCEAVYAGPGSFSPALVDNARVLLRLLTGDPHDVWHFVFAPNPRTSQMARRVAGLRRLLGWQGKVVQTIASAPKEFRDVAALLFGDAVVAQSEHTKRRLEQAGARGHVWVIPPCAAARPKASTDAQRAFREQNRLGAGPIALYPGDYEVSSGARTVLNAAKKLRAKGVTTVMACRQKTPRAVAVAAELRALDPEIVHLGGVTDMGLVLSAADVVLFPVDDLFGKVDIPMVLLEAMALEKPIIVCERTPPHEIPEVRSVAAGDAEGLADAALTLIAEGPWLKGRALFEAHYHPSIVAPQYEAVYQSLFGPLSRPRG